MLYPLKFIPQLVERVWGGQALGRFGKQLSGTNPVGESWEISDRDEAPSVVAEGPDAGRSLREVIAAQPAAILGTRCGRRARFPLLIKLLDARERLSLQVHPPAAVAPQLGGEPKTEMWYILDAAPDAHLIAGLKRGVTRDQFEQALRREQLEPLVHRFPVQRGDAVFIPSGRLHAIDAGLVIVEIQQSSDTTYRVYDWGRTGLDGQPRQLHIAESMASIDFADTEPGKQPLRAAPRDGNTETLLAACEHFHVAKLDLPAPWNDRCDGTSFHVLGTLAGAVEIVASNQSRASLQTGEFALLPAALGGYELRPQVAGSAAIKAWVPG